MAALDSEGLDTDERPKIKPRFDSMKLVAQIAGGIFFAGLISWIFWMSILVAAVPKITIDESKLFAKSARQTEIIHIAPPTTLHITARAECANFVQMEHGEKHCLVPQPSTEYAAR
jgi:hypothetical protein